MNISRRGKIVLAIILFFVISFWADVMFIVLSRTVPQLIGRRDEPTDIVTESYEFESISAIDLNLDACEVVCQQDKQPSVTVERKNCPEVKVEMVGDVLHITQGRDNNPLSVEQALKVTISVPPASTLDFLALAIDVGNLEVDDVSAREIGLAAGTGNISLSGVTADATTLTVDTGSIAVKHFADIESADVTLKSEVGSISFLGTIESSPFMRKGAGPTLTATVDIGEIAVTG